MEHDPTEIAKRMLQTFEVTGDKWFKAAADTILTQAQEIERMKAALGEVRRRLWSGNEAASL